MKQKSTIDCIDDDNITPSYKKQINILFIYVIGVLQTDSSSDEDSSEYEEESELEHEWGELDADAETTEESTKR